MKKPEPPQTVSLCNCGDLPPGGKWPKGEGPPKGCPVHDQGWRKIFRKGRTKF